MLNSYYRHRLQLLTAVAVGFGLFWIAGDAFHLPLFPGHETSLLQAPSPGVGLLIVTAVLIVATVFNSIIAGGVRFDAGLFAAAMGMSALSMRAGPIGETLRAAANASPDPHQSPTIYLTLAVELLALYGLVAVGWWGVWRLHRGERLPKWMPRLQADDFADGVEGDDHTLTERLSAMAVAAAATGILLMLLARSDEKAQVLIAVLLSSFVGTLIAYAVYPVTPSAWFWAGPLLVGLVGYLSGRFGADAGWRIGNPQWLLAPLARPAPLDYASFGPAGAILGYWTARHHHQSRQMEEAAAQEAA